MLPTFAPNEIIAWPFEEKVNIFFCFFQHFFSFYNVLSVLDNKDEQTKFDLHFGVNMIIINLYSNFKVTQPFFTIKTRWGYRKKHPMESSVLVRVRTEVVNKCNVLYQGSQTRGPRAACGPPYVFVRPASSFKLFKLLIKLRFL